MATPTDELVAIMRQRLLRETGEVVHLERSRAVPEVNRHALAAPVAAAVEPPVPTITGTPAAAGAPALPASTDAARDGRHQTALDLSFAVDFTAKAAAKGAADADRTLLVCKVEQYACGYLSFARSWDAAKGAVQSQSLQVAAAAAAAADSTAATAAAAGGSATGAPPTKSFRVVRAGAAGAPAYTWTPSQVDLAAYGLSTGNCFVVSTLREGGGAGKPATGDVKGRVDVAYQVTGLEAETGYAFQVVPGVLTIKAGAAPVLKATTTATTTTATGDGATTTTAPAAPAAAAPAGSFTLVWGAPSATSATLTTLSAAEQAMRDAAAAEALKALQEATNAKMQADLMAIASSGTTYGANVFAARVGAYESRIAKTTQTKGPSPAASSAAAPGSGSRVPRPSAAAATAATGTGPSKGRVHIDRKELEGTMARIAALEGALQASRAAAAAAQAALAAANAAAKAAAEKAAAADAAADASAAAEAARVEAEFAAQRSAQAEEALASQTEDVAALRETVTQVLAEAAASGPAAGAAAAPAAASGDAAAAGGAPAAAAGAATAAAAAAGGAAADAASGGGASGGFFSYIGSFVGFSS